ncbi:MAG: sigma-54-dependent Fis family transcriptional regulator [Deltaproteobacteria bacterium]|nr:sigma-54-dependent Fis family transcriptional regulator [Deltaproteobacteria bacterium]
MRKPVILLAERDEALRQRLHSFLVNHGFEVLTSSDLTGLLRTLRQQQSLDLLIVSTGIEVNGDGSDVVQFLRQWNCKPPVILLAVNSCEELAIAALKAGVADYFKCPFSFIALLASVQRCFFTAGPGESKALRDKGENGQAMIGDSSSMQEIKTHLRKVAATESNTLITGETGTGKELVASLIHHYSRRRQNPFICINCAAIPDSLLESELFGYERGAFTGAHSLKEGRLKLADGGTLFFDEIGDMSAYAQAKILRAIESRAVERLGGTKSVPLNIRVIAATNRNLDQLVAEEKFRADLYFRLNVANIHLPPLRERKEDLPMLCQYYVEAMNRQFGQQVEGVTDETLASLLRHDWPGNVRELKNVIEAAFVNQPAHRIALADLPQQFRARLSAAIGLPQDEREQLLDALLTTNWNKSKVAQIMKWSRMTVYRKMTKYHLQSSLAKPGSQPSADRYL